MDPGFKLINIKCVCACVFVCKKEIICYPFSVKTYLSSSTQNLMSILWSINTCLESSQAFPLWLLLASGGSTERERERGGSGEQLLLHAGKVSNV